MTRSKRIPKGKIGTCAYCGKYEEVTDDHVPPQGLFASPKPSDMITVEACDQCHRPWSKDDEYFKIRLCLNDRVREHPDVKRNLESVFRALNRPEASGLKKSLLDDWRDVEVRSKGGVITGTRPAFKADMNRICRVVERTVRGLLFYETKRPLPKGYSVKVIYDEDFFKQRPDVVKQDLETVLAPLAAQTPRVVGQNAFAYRHYVAPETPTTTVWILTYYDAMDFIGLTGSDILRDTCL